MKTYVAVVIIAIFLSLLGIHKTYAGAQPCETYFDAGFFPTVNWEICKRFDPNGVDQMPYVIQLREYNEVILDEA